VVAGMRQGYRAKGRLHGVGRIVVGAVWT